MTEQEELQRLRALLAEKEAQLKNKDLLIEKQSKLIETQQHRFI